MGVCEQSATISLMATQTCCDPTLDLEHREWFSGGSEWTSDMLDWVEQKGKAAFLYFKMCSRSEKDFRYTIRQIQT